MRELVASSDLVAYCGLYCGACRSYLKERCAGCHDNAKATWCKVRSCCIESELSSCADCTQFPDPSRCAKFNNFISKLFGVLLRSDRPACIAQIRRLGAAGHAEAMAAARCQTIRRQRR